MDINIIILCFCIGVLFCLPLVCGDRRGRDDFEEDFDWPASLEGEDRL